MEGSGLPIARHSKVTVPPRSTYSSASKFGSISGGQLEGGTLDEVEEEEVDREEERKEDGLEEVKKEGGGMMGEREEI